MNSLFENTGNDSRLVELKKSCTETKSSLVIVVKYVLWCRRSVLGQRLW